MKAISRRIWANATRSPKTTAAGILAVALLFVHIDHVTQEKLLGVLVFVIGLVAADHDSKEDSQ